jgi:outer membrane protein TolC
LGGGGGVLYAERRLRYIVGLPILEGTRLIPADTPTTAPLVLDWSSDYTQALGQRPELIQVQQEIRKGELLLARANNDRLPDLRFFSRVGVNGIGTNFADAVEDLNQFDSRFWDLGLVMELPFGNRQANAVAARVRLEIARRHAFLREQEELIISTLQRSHRDLVQLREEIQIRHSRRQAAALQYETRLEKFRQGAQTIDLLLDAQRRWADALRDEYVAICNYNIALADYERQKGSILEYHNVCITDGELPHVVHVHASEFIRDHCLACDPTAVSYTPPPRLPDAQPRPVAELLDHHKDLPPQIQ